MKVTKMVTSASLESQKVTPYREYTPRDPLRVKKVTKKVTKQTNPLSPTRAPLGEPLDGCEPAGGAMNDQHADGVCEALKAWAKASARRSTSSRRGISSTNTECPGGYTRPEFDVNVCYPSDVVLPQPAPSGVGILHGLCPVRFRR